MPRIEYSSDSSPVNDTNDIVTVAAHKDHEGSTEDLPVSNSWGDRESSRPKQKIPRSWVYDHAEKKVEEGKSYFYCRVELKNGKLCGYKIHSPKGSTSNISNHLKEKHNLKQPEKEPEKRKLLSDPKFPSD
jgi:hypothetical protein